MGLTALALLSAAWATPSFDPAVPEQVFSGLETFTTDGSFQLWAAIERHRDGDAGLFGPQMFNGSTAWPEDNPFMPFIATCFGASRPDSGAFLLHVGLGAPWASGTPVLLVPGAGDNASRGFVLVALDLAAQGRPVYGLTFSHPHGDVFEQAEVVADAIARIRERTGAAQVDVVSHSKGGVATAIYLSHTPSADWGSPAYEASGTPYRGDVRRAVFIGTPLDGLDTAFRWPALNYTSLEGERAASPTSWSTYYPSTTGFPLVREELGTQDFFPGGGDLFPGQRQVLKRQGAPLPGGLSWLGAVALAQQDWYTTYEGGVGFYSESRGIDAAIEAGGHVMDRLSAQGVDPDVELFLLAGTHPLLTNGAWLLADELTEGALWLDLLRASVDVSSTFLSEVTRRLLPQVRFSEADLTGVASGNLILGEFTAPSDGLVFVSSATHTEALTARGAQVREVREVELAHLDLLYANPVSAENLRVQAEADPVQFGWTLGLADRYEAADTVGWIRAVLADPAPPDVEDTGTGTPPASDSDAGEADPGGEVADAPLVGCECGPGAAPSGLLWWGWALTAWGARRRRRA
jgi:pimeloyl-ACP methyl ester carboxylesterase